MGAGASSASKYVALQDRPVKGSFATEEIRGSSPRSSFSGWLWFTICARQSRLLGARGVHAATTGGGFRVAYAILGM